MFNRAGHCVKSAGIRRSFGQHFPSFILNMERYVSLHIQFAWGEILTRRSPNTGRLSLCIQSKWGTIRTRKAPNMDTFQTVGGNSNVWGIKWISFSLSQLVSMIIKRINDSYLVQQTKLLLYLWIITFFGLQCVVRIKESKKYIIHLHVFRGKYCLCYCCSNSNVLLLIEHSPFSK